MATGGLRALCDAGIACALSLIAALRQSRARHEPGGVYYGWRLRRFRVQVGGSLPMAERLGARNVAST